MILSNMEKTMEYLKPFLIVTAFLHLTSCLQVKEIDRNVKQVSESLYAYTLTLHYEVEKDEGTTLDFSEKELLLHLGNIKSYETWNVWKKELPTRKGGFVGELTVELKNITLELDNYYDSSYKRRLMFKEIALDNTGPQQISNNIDIEANFNRSKTYDGSVKSILSTKTLGNGPFWMETPPDICRFDEGSSQTFTWRLFTGGFIKPHFTLRLYAVEFGDFTQPTLELIYNTVYDEQFQFPNADMDYSFEETDDGIIMTVEVTINKMTSSQYRGSMTLDVRDYDSDSYFIQGIRYSHFVAMHPVAEKEFYEPGDLYIIFKDGVDDAYLGQYYSLTCTGFGYDVLEVGLYHNSWKLTDENLKERKAALSLVDNPNLNYKLLSLTLSSFTEADAGEYTCNVYSGDGQFLSEAVNVKLSVY